MKQPYKGPVMEMETSWGHVSSDGSSRTRFKQKNPISELYQRFWTLLFHMIM